MSQATTNSRLGSPLTPKQKRKHEADQREQERRDRLAVEQRAKKRGFVKRSIVGPDGKRVDVVRRKSIIDSLRLETHQLAAYERFASDVYLSGEDNIRASGFEPGVDGSKADPHRAHLTRQIYVKRLAAASVYIGVRASDILMSCYHSATAQDLHFLGGPQHKIVGEEVRKILDDLSAFYTGGQRRVDSLWKAANEFIEISRRQNLQVVDEMIKAMEEQERGLETAR